jgi:protein ImuA
MLIFSIPDFIRTKMEYLSHPILAKLPSQRMHEACGSGRFAFAAMRASVGQTPIVWIAAPRSTKSLCPLALSRFFDPSRLVVIHPPTPKEGLWCMEEALRGAAAFVISDLGAPADLTQSRRLQLAAQAGGSTGLCLIPDGPVNNAAETRWRSTPLPCAQDSTLHHCELIKNKKGILGSWDVCWDDKSRSIRVVSVSGGGASAAPPEYARAAAPLRGGGDAQKRLAALLAQSGGGGTGVDAGHGAGGCAGDSAGLGQRDRAPRTASLVSERTGPME